MTIVYVKLGRVKQSVLDLEDRILLVVLCRKSSNWKLVVGRCHHYCIKKPLSIRPVVKCAVL